MLLNIYFTRSNNSTEDNFWMHEDLAGLQIKQLKDSFLFFNE